MRLATIPSNVRDAVGRERAEERLEPVHPVAALRQDAAVHDVGNREAIVDQQGSGAGPASGALRCQTCGAGAYDGDVALQIRHG